MLNSRFLKRLTIGVRRVAMNGCLQSSKELYGPSMIGFSLINFPRLVEGVCKIISNLLEPDIILEL